MTVTELLTTDFYKGVWVMHEGNKLLACFLDGTMLGLVEESKVNNGIVDAEKIIWLPFTDVCLCSR